MHEHEGMGIGAIARVTTQRRVPYGGDPDGKNSKDDSVGTNVESYGGQRSIILTLSIPRRGLG